MADQSASACSTTCRSASASISSISPSGLGRLDDLSRSVHCLSVDSMLRPAVGSPRRAFYSHRPRRRIRPHCRRRVRLDRAVERRYVLVCSVTPLRYGSTTSSIVPSYSLRRVASTSAVTLSTAPLIAVSSSVISTGYVRASCGQLSGVRAGDREPSEEATICSAVAPGRTPRRRPVASPRAWRPARGSRADVDTHSRRYVPSADPTEC